MKNARIPMADAVPCAQRDSARRIRGNPLHAMTKKPKSATSRPKHPKKKSAAQEDAPKSRSSAPVSEPHAITAFADLEAVTGAQSTFTK